MEAVLASNDKSPLIGELALGLKESSPYVISRNKATFYSHTPRIQYNQTNVLQINISSSTAWFDMASHGLAFTVHNDDDTQPLQFVSANPAILFRRAELRCGGVLVDDITDYNRLCNLFTIYQSTGKRLQTSYLGFDTVREMAEVGSEVKPQLFDSDEHFAKPIEGGKSKRVVMTLDLLSLFNQTSWVPAWAINGGIDVR